MPRIHLAIDNCFASKRWTSPLEWGALIGNELGLRCVEASADTENDPLYTTPAWQSRWIDDVREARECFGVHVVNLYSGHGTYATLGLAHTDASVREHLLRNWFAPMARTAGMLQAGMGFFAHAFALPVLEDANRYARERELLEGNLAAIARMAHDAGVTTAGVEQMYSPHQIPWTISGARDLITAVTARAGAPFYLTIDLGHQCAQHRYQHPDSATLESWLLDPSLPLPWVGTIAAAAQMRTAAAGSTRALRTTIDRVLESVAAHPYLFAAPADGDPYAWLKQVGCYSPIIHLQQTNGTVSAHHPFTGEYNKTGMVQPEKVVSALQESYRSAQQIPGLPRCEDIYLTIEVFSATADAPWMIIERLKESVTYWRNVIPHDGIRLDQIVPPP